MSPKKSYVMIKTEQKVKFSSGLLNGAGKYHSMWATYTETKMDLIQMAPLTAVP